MRRMIIALGLAALFGAGALGTLLAQVNPPGPPAYGFTPPLANQYPAQATPITGNSTGATGAIVGTLAAAANRTTYICGFNVQAIGGTSTVGPIVVAGLIGSSQTYQTDVNSATVGKEVAKGNFNPCIPASAVNTAITITTTADGTASAVDVNAWGYQQ